MRYVSEIFRSTCSRTSPRLFPKTSFGNYSRTRWNTSRLNCCTFSNYNIIHVVRVSLRGGKVSKTHSLHYFRASLANWILDFQITKKKWRLMVKRKKNSLCCSCSSLLNSSPYLSLVCMVSIMATILVLSSSGKEFNSCGSIFILVMCLCASCVSGVKKCRRLKKRFLFFFAPSSFSFFFFWQS